MNGLFTFLMAIAGRDHDPEWLIAEIHRRIATIRAEAVVFSNFIPAYFEQLTQAEIDDIITALWFLKIRTPIDDQILLELDVLGGALNFVGCLTRLDLRVREAIQGGGSQDPWENDDIISPA